MNFSTTLFQGIGEGGTFGIIFLAISLLSLPPGETLNWATKPVLSGMPGLTSILDSVPRAGLFTLLIGVAILLQVFKSGIVYVNSVTNKYFTARLRAKITTTIHRQILGFSFPCVSGYRIGELNYHMGTGPETVQKQINIASKFFQDLVLILVYLFILVALSPWLLLAATVMAFIVTLIQKRLLPLIKRNSYTLRDLNLEISQRVTQNIQALRLLHSSGELDIADQALAKRLAIVEKVQRKQGLLTSITEPVTSLLPLIAIGCIAAFSVVAFGSRSSGILPSLVTFVMALNRLNATFMSISNTFTRLSTNAASLDKLNEILSPNDKQFRRTGGRPFRRLEHSIQLRNVSLRYKPELRPSLVGIDLRIEVGQTVALVGSSGAGKSSLADLLVGLYSPSSGKILIDGVSFQEIDLPSWQHRLGVVSQDTFLFNDTLADNISFGAPWASTQQVQLAVESAQASDFIADLPEGLNTVIGERGYRLSGGQRQRISLARAILREPDLLILDEATSALDTESERLVQEAIERFERRHTVLVIAHRLSTIVNADLICVLDEGQIVERGSHRTLLAIGGRYAQLWNQQTKSNQTLLATQ